MPQKHLACELPLVSDAELILASSNNEVQLIPAKQNQGHIHPSTPHSFSRAQRALTCDLEPERSERSPGADPLAPADGTPAFADRREGTGRSLRQSLRTLR